MNILDDYKAERSAIIAATIKAAKTLHEDARLAVTQSHTSKPLLAAVFGLNTQYYELSWSSAQEKQAIFQSINAVLEENDVDGVALTFPGDYVLQGTDTKHPAIALLLRTADEQIFYVYPYIIEENEVKWLEPIEERDFETTLLRVPKLSKLT